MIPRARPRTVGAALIAALTVLAQAGCIGGFGGWVVYEGSRTSERAQLLSERGEVILDRDHAGPVPFDTRSREQVLALWGRPDEERSDGADLLWLYDRELGWSGVVLFVVFVPLPLLVPVGYRDTALRFSSDGSLIEIDRRRTTGTGGFCGYIILHGFSYGCTDRL